VKTEESRDYAERIDSPMFFKDFHNLMIGGLAISPFLTTPEFASIIIADNNDAKVKDSAGMLDKPGPQIYRRMLGAWSGGESTSDRRSWL
jgi:hypothetical protein